MSDREESTAETRANARDSRDHAPGQSEHRHGLDSPASVPAAIAMGAVGALFAALAALSALGAASAEVYATRAYGPLTHVLAPFVEAVPWSWSIMGMVLALAVLSYLFARSSGWARLGIPILALALCWTWFTAAWGVHYSRAPVADRLSLPTEATDAQMLSLGRYLLEVVEANKPRGISVEREGRVGAAVASISSSMERLTEEVDGLSVDVPDRVKILPGGMLLASGTSGIISPWLLEAHVDGGLPPAAQVAVAAHELAHLAGFAREDEAETMGAIAALNSPDAYARYAVALFQLVAVSRELPPGARVELLSQLPETASADLAATRRASARYQLGPLMTLSRSIYDLYLRSQGDADGIYSYARSTSLLGRAYASGWLRPLSTGAP